MKRPLVFLVAAPVMVAIFARLALAQVPGPPDRDFLHLFAVVLFFFTLPVSTLAGSFDAYLARALATPLRAPLIAAAGAVISSGLAFVLFSWFLPPPSYLAYFAIGGAACTGLCSLFAGEYSGQGPVVQANSLLRN